MENGYYKFELGSPIEVTIIKRNHSNDLIARCLSSKVKEDKLMLKYMPTNVIYFSSSLLERDDCGDFVSCYIDSETSSVYVGCRGELDVESGVLTFSGFLSGNNMVESNKLILGNSRVEDTIKSRVRILSIGLKCGKLFALYFIPNSRGMSVGLKDERNRGISTNSMKVRDCQGYKGFIIDDWFKGAKIVER